MERKRVTFKVAKVLKEAGYPQGITARAYILEEYGIFKIGSYLLNRSDIDVNKADVPTYFDVWLWLWEMKKIYINIFPNEKGTMFSIWDSELCEVYEDKIYYKSPEEAIITAIKYIVDNNLLK